jgi:peroxiredoxin
MQLPAFVRTLTVAGVLSAAALVQAQDAPKPADAKPAAKVGEAAPDFTLNDMNGKAVKLSDYKDKVVVLEWVNQQCPWCQKAIPAVKELRKKYDPKGVAWLAIDSTYGRKPEDNVAFVKEKELNYAILMDEAGTVGRAYGARTTPHVFVISKGKLVYAGALHNNQDGSKKDADVRNYVDDALQAALDGKDAPVAETKPWGCNVKYQEQKPPRDKHKDEPAKDKKGA